MTWADHLTTGLAQETIPPNLPRCRQNRTRYDDLPHAPPSLPNSRVIGVDSAPITNTRIVVGHVSMVGLRVQYRHAWSA
jgi:hypothetical protein